MFEPANTTLFDDFIRLLGIKKVQQEVRIL